MNTKFPELDPAVIFALVLLGLATMVLKGFALYRAASRSDKGWFAALFILNTAGILELIYLLAVSKKKN